MPVDSCLVPTPLLSSGSCSLALHIARAPSCEPLQYAAVQVSASIDPLHRVSVPVRKLAVLSPPDDSPLPIRPTSPLGEPAFVASSYARPLLPGPTLSLPH